MLIFPAALSIIERYNDILGAISLDCKQFFKQINGKKIAMCGIGVSNTPLVLNFLSKGATVYACDRRSREQIGALADELEAAGAALRLGDGYLDNLEVDIIFRTPGMNFNLPELEAARKKGIAVTSEMEVFFDLCPATIFAVTGSDGKTTTTTLIAKMLEAEGKTVHLGGNIGKPLLPEIEGIKPEDFVVAELSSFQLISMRKSPDVAVVTNVAPNHLDIHKDMDEYVEAKKNILLHQNAFSRTVLNRDNDITREFRKYVRGQSLSFSMEQPLKNGAWLDTDGTIHMAYRGIDAPIMHRSEIAMLGDHNVENCLAAIAAVWGYVSMDSIKRVAHEFKGVEHRIEFVKEVNGVRYYNDSKGTNPDAAIKGIQAMNRPTILIGGGYDKQSDFHEWIQSFDGKVRYLVLIGATKEQIQKEAAECGFHDCILKDTFEEALDTCVELARPGDAVLLSPACASWGQFDNYEQRGDMFKEYVKAL